jgi:hypothetical protein
MIPRSAILRPAILLSLIMLLCIQVSFGSPIPEEKDNNSREELLWQTSTALPAAHCQEVVDKFSSLINSQELPDHLERENAEKTDEDFDVNQYFTVLDRLFMEPGYVLDYVYYYGGIGGEPVLYARKADQPAYRNYTEFSRESHTDSPLDEDAYLDHIQTDGTPEGFFQLAVLRIMGGQFYLFWHANYDDYQIICDRSKVSPSLAGFGKGSGDSADPSFEEALMEARQLDFAPVVEMNEDAVRVQVVGFTNWGGFIRKAFTLRREFPHEILKEDSKVLAPYNCGIMF